MQETEFNAGDLAWEEDLEKEIATYFTILVLRILWTEKSGGLWSLGSQRI